MRIAAALLALLSLAPLLGGCAADQAATSNPRGESTLGAPANLQLFTDAQGPQGDGRRPDATFPATLAVVRIQGPGYITDHGPAYGQGAYRVVLPAHDPAQGRIDQLAHMPQVHRVVQLSQALLPDELTDDLPLRHAAHRLHADVLLVYTLDTRVKTDKPGNMLDKVTFGFLHDRHPAITTSASALIMDVKTGYLFGLAQAHDKQQRHTNYWGIDSALAQIKGKTRQGAFDKLMADVRRTWSGIVDDYGPNKAKRHARPPMPAGAQAPDPNG